MTVALYRVDAFTDKPFAGNPAAVCLLSAPHEDAWLQAVAREMNVSATAFLLPQPNGLSLRWFTPVVEEDICGHATLASAHVLWETGRVSQAEPITFQTLSGPLTVARQDDWIELNFLATPNAPGTCPPELIRALGTTPRNFYHCGPRYLLEVATEEDVRNVKPDFALLRSIPGRGVIVTSRAQSGYDVVSRYFAPWVGVNEDPVTGNAHCCLARFWCERLGKNEFLAYQASARGGEVRVRLEGDRAFLGGHAVTIMHGEFVDE